MSKTEFERIKKDVDSLTPEERVVLFQQYCTECGTDKLPCSCWKEE